MVDRNNRQSRCWVLEQATFEIMVGNDNILALILLWSRDYSIFENVYASFP